MRAIMLCDSQEQVNRVYPKNVLEELKKAAGLEELCYSKEAVLGQKEAFGDVTAIFSTWGMPVFSEEEIRQIFPKLEALFYAAGSVQTFARPFLNCGVKVFSAWAARSPRRRGRWRD